MPHETSVTDNWRISTPEWKDVKPIRTFTVIPSLPAPLVRLRDLAYNLRWAWNHATIELFRRLDGDLWERSGHNPVRMLGSIEQAQLEAAATDDGFLAHLDGVSRSFDTYQTGESAWFRRKHGATAGPLVAYFSAEFGLTECLSIFAGGLGVLAGDHLKSASDLGVPLVGVGLLYQQGYFRQYLNQAGWQQEAYPDNDFHNLPLTLVRRPEGTPLTVEITYPGRSVAAQVWRATVGRVALYLLDTNIATNPPGDRDITDQLYGGDLEMRIQQEIMLGIGGCRTLEALGLEPVVYHMNEGHSAFLALERVRRLMRGYGLSFAEAREAATPSLVFTTHTSVPAGHDYFPPTLMDRYFSDYARDLGISRQDFLALGRQNPADEGEHFCMTVLALRLAAHRNGVSRLHGQVSRRAWQRLWPEVPEGEVPIGHVTNGVHFRSWISEEMNLLYDRYLGLRWQDEPADQTLWQRVDRIPAEELWRTHERRRERLVGFARRRLREQLVQRNAPRVEIEGAEEVLNPDALTIGFGRRFATYKRANLLLRDPERLARLLGNPTRPVQVIFAGKAHPRDDEGKRLIQQVIGLARQETFRHRLVFVENYDMAVARYLVQGSDVWLNTPRRPWEASGTSGMKAAANGGLNLSTLDGWWDEAWPSPEPRAVPIGWAIGRGESFAERDSPDHRDEVDADALYDLLEQDVVPTFYDRGADGLPRQWIARMKASLGTLCHLFNAHRMVREYTERYYVPAAARHRELAADSAARARALAAWRARVQAGWGQVRVVGADSLPLPELPVGSDILVRARVHLGALTPDDVAVELYIGRVDAKGEIAAATTTPMHHLGQDREGLALFEANAVPCRTSGLHGYTVRVLPRHPDLTTPFVPGLITWAGTNGQAGWAASAADGSGWNRR
ncbi:MAG: alpha-glucan family phosphorylase [Chloroflexi bacterium]|nr:alpha-glucan family phosphorylase [Chloroflexota bacterium]